jgi:rubrerythrin
MARRSFITQAQKDRIAALAASGLSISEIAGALKISADTVRNEIIKQRMEVKNVEKHKSTVGSEKTDRKRSRPGAPSDPKPAENRGEPQPHSTNDHSDGETSISFVGGKRHKGEGEKMSKDGTKEEFDWECPSCHHQFNGNPDKCPKCGKDLQE